MDLDDEELKATKILNGAANRFQIKEYIKKNYIPKQKVKDKIEELKERKHNLIYTQPLETIKRINAQIKILEELLEDR